MCTYLSSLPVELTELITHELDVDALRNIRLVCRALCENVTRSKRFTDLLRHQRRRLIQYDLGMLLTLAKHETFSQHVTALTLVIPVYNGGTLRKMIETRKCTTSVETRDDERIETTEDCDEETLEKARDTLKWMTSQNVAHGRHASLLGKVFGQLQNLRSLTIEAAVLSYMPLESENHPGNDHTEAWQARWLYVANGCQSVFWALGEAQPGNLQHLDILPTINSRSLTLPAMASLRGMLNFNNFGDDFHFNNIKTLSLRVASDLTTEMRRKQPLGVPEPPEDDGFHAALRYCSWTQGKHHWGPADAADERQMMTSTASFIALMPGLEALDLYFGDPSSSRTPQNKASSQVFHYISELVYLPLLHKFVLRGFHCTAFTLMDFLDFHPKLTHMELHNIRLTEGDWQPVFDHMSQMAHLEEVLLDSIWADKLVHLGMSGDGADVWAEKSQWFPRSGPGVTRLLHTRRFNRAQLLQGLHFVPYTQGRPLDSPQSRTWRMNMQKEYRSR